MSEAIPAVSTVTAAHSINDIGRMICEAAFEDDAVALLEGAALAHPDVLEAVCRHYVMAVRANESKRVRASHKVLPNGGSVRAEAILAAAAHERANTHLYAMEKSLSELRDEARLKAAAARTILDTWLYKGMPLGDMTRKALITAAEDFRGRADGAQKASQFYRELAKQTPRGLQLRETLSVEQVLAIKDRIWSC